MLYESDASEISNFSNYAIRNGAVLTFSPSVDDSGEGFKDTFTVRLLSVGFKFHFPRVAIFFYVVPKVLYE